MLTVFQCSLAGLDYFLGLRNVLRLCVPKVDKHLQEMTIPSWDRNSHKIHCFYFFKLICALNLSFPQKLPRKAKNCLRLLEPQKVAQTFPSTIGTGLSLYKLSILFLIFPVVLLGRICFKIKIKNDHSHRFVKTVIFKEEIWCWLLLRARGVGMGPLLKGREEGRVLTC